MSVGSAGALTLVDDASIGGIIFPRAYDGELTIEPSCAGSGTINLPPSAPTSTNPVHVDVHWVEDRSEVTVIQTDPGTFIAGTAVRRDPAASCTAAAFEGRFGFVAEGTDSGAAYVAGGLFVIGADGSVAVEGTQSTDGSVAVAEPSAGTLGAFDADCRADVTDADGAWMAVTAIDDDPFSFVRTVSGQVVTGVARRMHEGCSLASVEASYGYAMNAVVYLDVPGFPVGASPFAGAGHVDVAADGSLALVDTASIAGIVIPRSYTGTVTVGSDCVGSALVELPPEAPTSTNPVNILVYWVGDGSEAYLIQQDPGTFIAGSAVRRDLLP